MPSHQEHCADSMKRYGKTFSEVHTWMDEPSLILGSAHRQYRHDPYVTPIEAKAIFGDFADHVCLDHIRLDEQENRKRANELVKLQNNPEITNIQPVIIKVQSTAGSWNLECKAVTLIHNGKTTFTYLPQLYLKNFNTV
jgi:hypothetical protein